MTQRLKYQGMQQVMAVDQELLDQKTKPPVVDHNKLKVTDYHCSWSRVGSSPEPPNGFEVVD